MKHSSTLCFGLAAILSVAASACSDDSTSGSGAGNDAGSSTGGKIGSGGKGSGGSSGGSSSGGASSGGKAGAGGSGTGGGSSTGGAAGAIGSGGKSSGGSPGTDAGDASSGGTAGAGGAATDGGGPDAGDAGFDCSALAMTPIGSAITEVVTTGTPPAMTGSGPLPDGTYVLTGRKTYDGNSCSCTASTTVSIRKGGTEFEFVTQNDSDPLTHGLGKITYDDSNTLTVNFQCPPGGSATLDYTATSTGYTHYDASKHRTETFTKQ